MKIQPITIPISLALLFSGCAGGSATRIVGDTAGAAGGALLGHKLDKGNSAYTDLGAGGWRAAQRVAPGGEQGLGAEVLRCGI